MNVQSPVTVSSVKGWLKKEEENVRPYLAAWKGENPYDVIGSMRFFLSAAIASLIVAVIFAMIKPPKHWDTVTDCLICISLVVSLFGWWDANKSLKKFCFAVAWCENHHIDQYLLQRGHWTKDDVGDVLRFFVTIINERIIPHEREINASQYFPRRLTEARRKHGFEKAILMGMLKNISPMFNHFYGVKSPLAEAFRLAGATKVD